MVKRDDLQQLDFTLGSIYQKRLESCSIASYSMVGFHHSSHPVRFSVVDEKEFESLPSSLKNLEKFVDCTQPFYWHYSKESNSFIPGVVVSMWDTLDSMKGYFEAQFAQGPETQ